MTRLPSISEGVASNVSPRLVICFKCIMPAYKVSVIETKLNERSYKTYDGVPEVAV